jgi:hypothetical protein
MPRQTGRQWPQAVTGERPQSRTLIMPETVALAKQLHAEGLSYRKISAALAEHGHVTGSGKPHVASAVQKMLGR